MVWFQFIISAAIIVLVAIKLAEYGDAIALRTNFGGVFVGTLLLAGATSLPELLTTINSINQGVPDLAAGNLFGSNMFNMFMLAALDLMNRQKRILRQSALKHALSGSLATFLIGLSAFFILSNIDLKIGWVGLDSLTLIIVYIVAIWIIQSNNSISSPPSLPREEDLIGVPKLVNAILGFLIATGILVVVTPWLVESSAMIAEITGLGMSFVGTTLLAFVTSLPELVTTMTAVRLGASDLAIGNLFGSNMFNIFALGLSDLFFLDGRYLGSIDPSFVIIGLLGLIMTGMGLIGNLVRLERKIFFIEIDALLLILVYIGGLYFLYTQGINP
ncbi:MAG: hypothetical protein CL609_06525 [Anaerolineaceae bacterium]|nr:hypothetical protein [Anaerolineaceae bacterium]